MTTSTSPDRRQPLQARAAARRARFLEVATQLIGTKGYEAVSMKAIAQVAGASVGTLYDYFPDKPAVALALLADYADELDAYWARVFAEPPAPCAEAFADQLMDAVLGFVQARPAYLPLISSPVAYSRSTAQRQPLRHTIAGALQHANTRLSAERAHLAANVIVELFKALLAVLERSAPEENQRAIDEFRLLMKLYLDQLMLQA
ncbi:TetR/AcrR family transcriptional regulator [Pseudomonas sp. dw_358]|uniref:TetR/AcrR family transcriptional regulator n=1 Tax=Pseudomonas sp. dw_358 TaxID=2720083 RepID=UPI001BD42554|nr:TetR/AcrR family transcriptional regulator [Pseudomonas sp. dw_358]